MCYCYRKLVNLSIFNVFYMFERPNSASHGLSRPPMHSLTLFPVIWLAQRESPRPWEAVRGRIRPLIPSASQHFSCDLSEPMRASHGLTDRPHRFESPIGLSRLRAIWLISRLNALLRPVCVRGRSDSQICEADLWGRGSPESPIGLSRLGAIWLISRLNALLRPVCVRGRSDSQICEADLWGRGSPIGL